MHRGIGGDGERAVGFVQAGVLVSERKGRGEGDEEREWKEGGGIHT